MKMPATLEEAMRSGCFGYVRYTYGVPAGRGGRVRVHTGFAVSSEGREGRIARADHWVWVILDGERHSNPYHPTDLEYLTTPTT